MESRKCSATTCSGRPCSALTASGRRCRAWAVSGTDPPLCSAHAGRNVGAGAPMGNQNRLGHGFYSRYFSLQELADLLDTADIPALAAEISAAKIAVRRILAYLKENNGRHLPPDVFKAVIALVFIGTSTVGRLLRYQQALLDDVENVTEEAIAQALDELSERWDMDL